MVPTSRPNTATRAATHKDSCLLLHSHDECIHDDLLAQNAALDDTVVMNDDVVNERDVDTHDVDDVIMHKNVIDVDDRMRGNVADIALHNETRISHLSSDRENKAPT